MIPKIIHFCWFGGRPLPPLAQKCIASWKKFFPDYEIKLWDESNFDVNAIPYTRDAYKAKKYAFVSDYARYKIIYEYGGIYFDTDVEVLKPFDDILSRGAFMGCESKPKYGCNPTELNVNPGLGIAAQPGMPFYKEMLDLYEHLSFNIPRDTDTDATIVRYTSDKLATLGLQQTDKMQEIAGIKIYPWDFFCPMNPSLVLTTTANSHSIHHYAASWAPKFIRGRKWIKRLLGHRGVLFIQPFANFIRKFF